MCLHIGSSRFIPHNIPWKVLKQQTVEKLFRLGNLRNHCLSESKVLSLMGQSPDTASLYMSSGWLRGSYDVHHLSHRFQIIFFYKSSSSWDRYKVTQIPWQCIVLCRLNLLRNKRIEEINVTISMLIFLESHITVTSCQLYLHTDKGVTNDSKAQARERQGKW